MWLAKLAKMMNELPEKYLEPQPLDPKDKVLLPPDSKPVGQTTEEEKRLYGVCRQLRDSLCLEDETHQALHEQGMPHSPDVCQRFGEQVDLKKEELMLVMGILLRTLGEHFGFENDYMIDGYDIYTVTETMIAVASQTDVPEFIGEWPERES